MSINNNKPHQWKADIAASVDYYNNWFMQFAPEAYRTTRQKTIQKVQTAFQFCKNFQNLTKECLCEHPEILPVLRMSTCPPIARDRLIGLSSVPSSLVQNMENEDNPRVSPKLSEQVRNDHLIQIIHVIQKLIDKDIITWTDNYHSIPDVAIERACTIIADRLCSAMSDPIIRNAQEQRQLACISKWLNSHGYKYIENGSGIHYDNMPVGTYAYRMNIPVKVNPQNDRIINIPVDVVIKPKNAHPLQFPVLIEAKSAGDFTNVNKRRKEEATKITQLKQTYGDHVELILFLCGYFDSGYLGYEAAEGIDWIWEHRVEDFELCGL